MGSTLNLYCSVRMGKGGDNVASNKKFTCLGINREIRLSLKNAVNDSGTVSIGWVICIRGLDLEHISTWKIRPYDSSIFVL